MWSVKLWPNLRALGSGLVPGVVVLVMVMPSCYSVRYIVHNRHTPHLIAILLLYITMSVVQNSIVPFQYRIVKVCVAWYVSVSPKDIHSVTTALLAADAIHTDK